MSNKRSDKRARLGTGFFSRINKLSMSVVTALQASHFVFCGSWLDTNLSAIWPIHALVSTHPLRLCSKTTFLSPALRVPRNPPMIAS